MGMEATGTIYLISETQQISEKFSKREFVVEIADNPKYPQLVQFQCTGDRCAQLDGLAEGDKVRIEFSLRGREWCSPKGETKYFNSLDVWKIDVTSQAQRKTSGGQGAAPPPSGGAPLVDDDIPFASCDITHEPSPISRVLR